jgi:hypothetical protein
MLEIVEEHIQREVEALKEQRRGAVMMTVGKVLLWMDVILVCFVYTGLQTGSHLFLWWVLGEGLLGLALMGVATLKKADAERKLAALAPQTSLRNGWVEEIETIAAWHGIYLAPLYNADGPVEDVNRFDSHARLISSHSHKEKRI